MPHALNIVRSRRRKRSVALSVEPDGSLKVQAPLHTPLGWIERFIVSRAGWIAKRRADLQEKGPAGLGTLEPDSLIPYLGQSPRLDSILPQDFFTRFSPAVLQDEIKTELTLWYKKEARRVFAERVGRWAQTMNLKPGRLVVTGPRTQWGSCTSTNDIRLNWRLMMAASELVDYVVVHELAHIPHKHHGVRFWRCVEKFLPDWKARRQALRTFEKDPFYAAF